jgi:hypothetical protein
MQATNWQPVAAIIAALISAVASVLGPSLAIFVKARMENRTSSNSQASPDSVELRMFPVAWQFVKLHWKWIVLMYLAGSFCSLIWTYAIWKPYPVTSRSVVVIRWP